MDDASMTSYVTATTGSLAHMIFACDDHVNRYIADIPADVIEIVAMAGGA